MVEIFARATKKIKEGSLGRFMSFGKNVLLGNDTKMQDLLAKLEKLTKTEGHLVGAETLVEVKNAGFFAFRLELPSTNRVLRQTLPVTTVLIPIVASRRLSHRGFQSLSARDRDHGTPGETIAHPPVGRGGRDKPRIHRSKAKTATEVQEQAREDLR